mgnify:CR=1 FL=1
MQSSTCVDECPENLEQSSFILGLVGQAPMLGAGAEALAIAVSRAGGLGSHPAAGSTPGQLLESARAIRAATPAPFAINLFILEPCKPDPGIQSSFECWRGFQSINS